MPGILTVSKHPVIRSMGIRRGEKRAFPPLEISKKTEVRSLIPITSFNSCIDSLFSGITLTLDWSQVQYSGFMQWWACSSLMFARFPTEASWETSKRIVLSHNNNMATNLPSFTSNVEEEPFCRMWLLNADILASTAARQWLLIVERHAALYCLKKSMSESVAILPQVRKIHS